MKIQLSLIIMSVFCVVGCSKDDGSPALGQLSPLHFTPSPYYSGITGRDLSGNLAGPTDPTDWNGTGSLVSVRVYPNPWEITKHAGYVVVIDRLPPVDTITIYQNPFTVVRQLVVSGAGFTLWDLNDANGNPLPSGIYHAVITSGSDHTAGDIEIER